VRFGEGHEVNTGLPEWVYLALKLLVGEVVIASQIMALMYLIESTTISAFVAPSIKRKGTDIVNNIPYDSYPMSTSEFLCQYDDPLELSIDGVQPPLRACSHCQSKSQGPERVSIFLPRKEKAYYNVDFMD